MKLFLKKIVPLFFHWLYSSLYIQDLWFTHQWHHGDHSYFYWLVNGQPLFMLCHLSNPHQSTTPWEKKSTTQKWLRVERRNMIHACHATVLGMFHKSNVLSCLCHCYWFAIRICLCYSCTMRYNEYVCVCVWFKGWGYSWPCVVCSYRSFCHMPCDQPLALKKISAVAGGGY